MISYKMTVLEYMNYILNEIMKHEPKDGEEPKWFKLILNLHVVITANDKNVLDLNCYQHMTNDEIKEINEIINYLNYESIAANMIDILLKYVMSRLLMKLKK